MVDLVDRSLVVDEFECDVVDTLEVVPVFRVFALVSEESVTPEECIVDVDKFLGVDDFSRDIEGKLF